MPGSAQSRALGVARKSSDESHKDHPLRDLDPAASRPGERQSRRHACHRSGRRAQAEAFSLPPRAAERKTEAPEVRTTKETAGRRGWLVAGSERHRYEAAAIPVAEKKSDQAPVTPPNGT